MNNCIILQEKKINQVILYLILKGSFIRHHRFIHDKMERIISFMHYTLNEHNKLNENFAGERLEAVYMDNHCELPINMGSGSCNIRWGIDYLVQHRFGDEDTNLILEAIDLRIMERHMRCIPDLSLRMGLAGILLYDTSLLSAIRRDNVVLFDQLYLSDFRVVGPKVRIRPSVNTSSFLIENFIGVISGTNQNLPETSELLLSEPQVQPETLPRAALGLEDGIAGLILNEL